MKISILALLYFFFISTVDAQPNVRSNQAIFQSQLTGEDYITGEDGVPRMTVNVLGHVKYPGSFLVYDGIDLLTCISMAGGPVTGAKLSEVLIISKNGTTNIIDLNLLLENSKSIVVELSPHDTIYIKETLSNYLLARSNVINILLQITNLILISTNNR